MDGINWTKYSENSKPKNKGQCLVYSKYYFENKENFRVDLEWWGGTTFDNINERNIPLYFCEINKPIIE